MIGFLECTGKSPDPAYLSHWYPPTSVSHFPPGGSPKHRTLFLTFVALLLLSPHPEHACHLSSSGSYSPFSIKVCRLLFQKVFLQSLGSPVPLLCAPLAPQARLCPSTFIVMPTLSDDLEFVSLGAGFLKDGRHQLLFILENPHLRVAFGTQQSHICLLSCNSRLCPPRWLFWQTEDLSLSQSVPASPHNRGRSGEQLRAPESLRQGCSCLGEFEKWEEHILWTPNTESKYIQLKS